MNDEEVAFRIVRLYFQEIARLGFKRTLDLDQMIDAYFYTLKQLKGKETALKKATEKLAKEERENSKKVSLSESSVQSSTINIGSEKNVSSPPVQEKTITQIIEEN